MPKQPWLISPVLLLLLVLSACNLPSNVQAPEGAGAVLTAAAQTVEASLTRSAPQNSPTGLPTSTTVLSAATLAASPTSPPPAATATQDCDKAKFIDDVSIPDGTTLSPNESFTKTWRLKNIGTCSWTPSYAVVPGGGDLMSGPASQALTGNVNPGQTVDISINLKAPATDGNYKGIWKLRNAASVLFAQFYVDIKVSGGGAFAVTSVSYTLSTWGNIAHVKCPRVTASITTNGAGTIEYEWKLSSGTVPTKTLTFASAGTQSVSYKWARNSALDGTPASAGIYIDEPNHQDFGKKDFTEACMIP